MSALDGGRWSTAHHGHSTPVKDPVHFVQEAGLAQGKAWMWEKYKHGFYTATYTGLAILFVTTGQLEGQISNLVCFSEGYV